MFKDSKSRVKLTGTIAVALLIGYQSSAIPAIADSADSENVSAHSIIGAVVPSSDSKLNVGAISSDAPVGLNVSSMAPLPLSPEAREAALLLGILPKVERLIALRQGRSADSPMTDEELGLKVDVLDRIMGGSLEVRMVAGRIDRELSWSFMAQGMLQGKRQRILNTLFAFNFMQGGILGVLSGPAFLHGEAKTGTELLLLASSIGLGLSIISLYESRSGSKTIDGEPTVLANMFKLNPPETMHKPDMVIKFMNSVPGGKAGSQTRIEALMDGWKNGHYLRSMEVQHLQKVSAYTPPGEKYKENIGLIGDRIRMLFDTQWTVEQLDFGLLDLLRSTDLN